MAQHHWTDFREQDGSSTLTLEVKIGREDSAVVKLTNAFSGNATAEVNLILTDTDDTVKEAIITNLQNIAEHLVWVNPSTICQIIEDIVSNA